MTRQVNEMSGIEATEIITRGSMFETYKLELNFLKGSIVYRFSNVDDPLMVVAGLKKMVQDIENNIPARFDDTETVESVKPSSWKL